MKNSKKNLVAGQGSTLRKGGEIPSFPRNIALSCQTDQVGRKTVSGLLRMLVACCLGCWISSGVQAEHLGDSPNSELRYSSERFSSEENWGHGELGQLAQSGEGYLWLGTTAGLLRFDGEQFTAYNRRNTPTMADETITALAADRQGRVWAGTMKGLLRWDAGRFVQVNAGEGNTDPAITALTAAASGGMWVATTNSVSKVALNAPLRRYARPEMLGNATPDSLVELPDGHLLMGNGGAWVELNPDTGIVRPAQEQHMPSAAGIRAVLPADAQGRAWAVAAKGVSLRTPTGWEQKLTFPPEFAGEPTGLYLDPKGGVIVWLQRWGVFRWESTNDQGGFARIATGDPQWIRRASAVLRDREENLWVAGAEGLVRLHRRAARLWGAAEGWPAEACWSAVTGADGKLWVGTESGLCLIAPGNPVRRLSSPGRTNAVHLALPTRTGRVWCAVADRSLYWSDRPEDPESWQPLALGGRRVRALHEGRDGSVWVGTDNGAVKLQGQIAVPFPGEERLAPLEVSAIRDDRDGTIWFGTRGGGVFRQAGTEMLRYFGPDTLSDDNIWAIHADAEGGLWFGTNRGLTYHFGGRWHQLTREQGLMDPIVHGIHEDADKNLWLTSTRGVQRLWRPELEAVAAGGITQARALRLGALDGIDGLELAGERQPSGTVDPSGQLWLPTAQGLVQLDMAQVQENHTPPPVTVEDANFEGRLVGEPIVRRFSVPAVSDDPAVKPGARLRIPQDQGRFVQLRFTASTFLQPRKTRFRFRLIGHDLGWRETGDNRTAMYANLRAGDYDFEVQAANAHGVWNTHGARFLFSLVPRFYETGWFQGGCFLGLMFGGVGFARFHYRNRERRLETDRLALETERSRIARDLHDDLGANLTGLAMQAEIASYRLRGPASEALRGFAQTSRTISQRLREVIWAVDPECDTLQSLADFLGQQTDQLLGPTQLRYRFDTPDRLPDVRLRAGARHQLVMAAREALNNALKYAGASEIRLQLELSPKGLLILSIRDDGVGLPADPLTGASKPVVGGNGHNNMRQRLRSLGGNFRVSSAPGTGTLVLLEVPLVDVTAADSRRERPVHEHQSRDR